VYCIDVGHGQLAWKIASDRAWSSSIAPTSASCTRAHPGACAFAVVDVSFISLRLVLPVLPALLQRARLSSPCQAAFEVGRVKVGKGGIVRDPADRQHALDEVKAAQATWATRFWARRPPHHRGQGQRGVSPLSSPSLIWEPWSPSAPTATPTPLASPSGLRTCTFPPHRSLRSRPRARPRHASAMVRRRRGRARSARVAGWAVRPKAAGSHATSHHGEHEQPGPSSPWCSGGPTSILIRDGDFRHRRGRIHRFSFGRAPRRARDRVTAFDNFDLFYPAPSRAESRGAAPKPGFRLVEGDLTDPHDIDAAWTLRQGRRRRAPGALAGVRPSIKSPQRYWAVNVTGTLHLLSPVAHAVSSGCLRSSSSVYGKDSQVPSARPILQPAASPTRRPNGGRAARLHRAPPLRPSITCLRFFTVYGRASARLGDSQIHQLIANDSPSSFSATEPARATTPGSTTS